MPGLNYLTRQHHVRGNSTGPQTKSHEAIAYRKRINYKHVHLIQGNHDKDLRDAGCFESVAYYLKINVEGRKVILFHYPIAEWDGKWRGAIHLHGHECLCSTR